MISNESLSALAKLGSKTNTTPQHQKVSVKKKKPLIIVKKRKQILKET